MKFRKKPVVIEATQFKFPYEAEFEEQKVYCANLGVEILYDLQHAKSAGLAFVKFVIPTLEGNMNVIDGDWIITGVKGEKYPCKDNIFKETYEIAE